MKTTLLLSLLALNTNASMISYQADFEEITPQLFTGLFSMRTDIKKPELWSYTIRGNRSRIDKLKREGKVDKETCKKTSNGSLIGLSGARYECVSNEYKAKVEEYEQINAQFKKSIVSLNLAGFTKSYGKVFGETKFNSSLSSIDSQEYLVQFDIQKCLDQYGSWWNKSSELTQGQTKIEQHIQALFNETLQAYVRCDLRLTTITNKSGGHSGRVFSPVDVYHENFLIIEDESPRAHISSKNYYGSRTPLAYEEISKMPAGSDYDQERLNMAIEDYGNFMKFEYGLVLSEISMKELSNAEAQLKVQKFLGMNRAKILKMLKEIDQSMKPAPFFKKISAGFYISSVYGHISKIEQSLKTVLTLDHIIRSRR